MRLRVERVEPDPAKRAQTVQTIEELQGQLDRKPADILKP